MSKQHDNGQAARPQMTMQEARDEARRISQACGISEGHARDRIRYWPPARWYEPGNMGRGHKPPRNHPWLRRAPS